MACDCIATVNAKLEEDGHNTCLTIPLVFGGDGVDRLMIRTEVKTPKRGAKPVSMFASYCPFCGEKYNP